MISSSQLEGKPEDQTGIGVDDFTTYVDFEEDGDWEMELEKEIPAEQETSEFILGTKGEKENMENGNEKETLGLIFHRFDQLESLWKDRENLKMNSYSVAKNREAALAVKKMKLFPCILVMFPEVGPTVLVAIVVGNMGVAASLNLLRQVNKEYHSPSPSLSELRDIFMGEFGTRNEDGVFM
jgi:hypothetical protein